jgi:hypothetical protein
VIRRCLFGHSRHDRELAKAGTAVVKAQTDSSRLEAEAEVLGEAAELGRNALLHRVTTA